MGKKFNSKIKIKYSYVPYPIVHNIIRGTNNDINLFYLKVFLYSYSKIIKTQLSLIPFKEVLENSAVSNRSLYRYRKEESINDNEDNIQLQLRNKEWMFVTHRDNLWGEFKNFKFIIKKFHKKGEKPSKRILHEDYETKARKYFSNGKLYLCGDFQKIMYEKQIKKEELRVLLCLMRRIVNQKNIPLTTIDYFIQFTDYKAYKIREILKSLENKGLVICNHINKLRKDNYERILVSDKIVANYKDYDLIMKKAIEDHLEENAALTYDLEDENYYDEYEKMVSVGTTFDLFEENELI